MRLPLRPSRALAAAIMAAHGAAALTVVFLMKGFAGGALGGALLALGIAAAWRRALLRGAGAARIIDVSGKQATCELADGRRVRVAALRRRYVSRLLVTLPLEGPLRRTLLVTADMLSASEFRRLRVWALWGRVPGVAGEQLAA